MGLMEVVERIGKDIASSQMFSCKNEAQGRVIALSCLTTGRDILSVPEEYHLMNNKLSLQSVAMLGRLVKAGGSFKVLAHSPEKAEIEISYKGETFRERITWEEAQEEPFVYAGKQKEITDMLSGDRTKLVLSGNYATPRRRMQHLWARVVSDAVRVRAPDLVCGVYTPEEVADFSGLVTPEFKDSKSSVPVTAAGLKPQPQQQQEVSVQSYDGEAAEDPVSTEEQIARINELMDLLEIPEDKRLASFQRRGATGPEGLTESQADEVIAALNYNRTAQLEKMQAEKGTTVLNVNGPITPEYEKQLKDKIKQLAQSSEHGATIVEKVKSKLVASGLKMAQMRYGDARELMRQLDIAEIEDFFASELKPAEVAAGE